MFLFFQPITAHNWRTNAGCKCVSNVAVAAIDLP
jgi:hypothetical protein